MNQPPAPNLPQPIVVAAPRQTANWIIAVALSVIATTLVVRGDLPLLGGNAFAQNTLVGSRGLHAFTGQLDKNTYGLFMMDVDMGTIWVYEYHPLKKKLRLAASRSFTYDRYLENFNNDEGTSPDKIEKMVEQQRKSKLLARAANRPAETLPPEANVPAVEPPASTDRPTTPPRPADNPDEPVIDEAPQRCGDKVDPSHRTDRCPWVAGVDKDGT